MGKYTYTIDKVIVGSDTNGAPIFGTSDGMVKTATSVKEANGWWSEHWEELRGTYYLTRWNKNKGKILKGTVLRGKVLWVKKTKKR